MRALGVRRVGRRGKGRRDHGISLLEVAITIALLTSVGLATAILLVPVARQSRIQRETEIANLAARRLLEQFQATPFHDLVTDFPDGSVTAIPELPSGSITVSYVDTTTDPLVFRANLTWESPELGTMQRTFDAVRTE
jgi:Tfp pilus assembly protein PilV